MNEFIDLPKLQHQKPQSLQINRLVRFIQNKKSPSFHKLKEILSGKDCSLHLQRGGMLSDRLDRQTKHQQKTQREPVAINTRNIFVARNKTEACSPRGPQEKDSKNYKIFVTKEEILRLHQKEKSQYLASGIKQKVIHPSTISQEKQLKSNLFPPLTMPKLKRPVMFQKYEDQTTKWLNTEIKSIKESLSKDKDKKNGQNQQSLIGEDKTSQSTKQRIKNLHLQRQKYNKSLQKLIEKAFKNKEKSIKGGPNNLSGKILIQGIEGYDSKLVVQGQPYDSDSEANGESIYASKGKLLSHPNIKIKRGTRMKSERKTKAQDMQTPSRYNPQNLPIDQKQLQNEFQVEYRKRIIHTNRQVNAQSSSMKLKTQMTSKAAEYLPSSIRSSHSTTNKTLKLINQLQSSIIKDTQQPHQKRQRHLQSINTKHHIIINEGGPTGNNTINQGFPGAQKKRSRRKRQIRKPKVKTLQSSELSSIKKKKSAGKWELEGYDWGQSKEELEENDGLESYVETIVKRKLETVMLDQKFILVKDDNE